MSCRPILVQCLGICIRISLKQFNHIKYNWENNIMIRSKEGWAWLWILKSMLQRGSLVIVQLKRFPWIKGTLSGYFALITTSSLLSSTLALAIPTIIVETVNIRSRRVRCYSCGLRDRSLDVSKRCCSHLKKKVHAKEKSKTLGFAVKNLRKRQNQWNEAPP